MFSVLHRDDGDLEYPIDAKWRRDVIEAIGAKRGAQAKLARQIGCSPGTLNELLKNGRRSTLVPKIHDVLGWDPPPLPATGSTDQHEVEVFLRKMGKRGREMFRHLRELQDNPTAFDAAYMVIAELAKRASND